MRILIVLPLAALAAACNVSTDTNNSAVTVQYNEETARNAAEDVGNTAQNIGNAIANEANETANKVNNSKIVVQNKSEQNTATTENRQ
jgi:hypothetical protein